MDYISYTERLDYLLEMIENKRISSPIEIAQKFNCGDKTARNMINTLRKKGNPIKYDRQTVKYSIENR